MVFSCFVLMNNTRVVPYFESCMVMVTLGEKYDSKTAENHVLFSKYTILNNINLHGSIIIQY